MTRGYERSQILLKTQAHPPNPVWKDGLIHRWNSHDMSAHTEWDLLSLLGEKKNKKKQARGCLSKQRWYGTFGVFMNIESGRIMFMRQI